MALQRYCYRCRGLRDQGHTHRPKDLRASASKRGYDAAWRRTRAMYLNNFRICQHTGCRLTAQEVHHLDGKGPLGPRGHDFTNLQGLCKRHHSQTTARHQPGGFNAPQGQGND